MRALLALLGIGLLIGCAAHPKPDITTPSVAVVKNDKPVRVSRMLILAWDNIGRGGAAMREPGYIHALGLGEAFNKAEAKTQSSTHKALSADINEALDAFKSLTKGEGYSLYELSRWERYCNRGERMDERDWQFIETERVKHLPREIIVDCHPPTYTYQDYLSAWTSFCSGKTISKADRLIVRSSVRPFSVVNSCKALKGAP